MFAAPCPTRERLHILTDMTAEIAILAEPTSPDGWCWLGLGFSRRSPCHGALAKPFLNATQRGTHDYRSVVDRPDRPGV